MKLFWLDLETSGLDPQKHVILEVACCVAELTNPFELLLGWHGKNGPLSWCRGRVGDQRYGADPFVIDMHTKNGLWVDCEKSQLQLSDIENDLLQIVPEFSDADKEERWVLAGSSNHFDMGFLKAQMPRLAKCLSYRLYDVSAIKLFCWSLGMPKPVKAEAHRAAADILESMRHGRECVAWLKKHFAEQMLTEIKTRILAE